MDRSELLVKYGFIKKESEGNYTFDEELKEYKAITGKIKKSDADEEIKEVIIDQHDKTGFPTPRKAYALTWEVYDLSMEEPYFWFLDEFKNGFPQIDKLEDSFAAAENSAFFGISQIRIGGQQDKVTQLLATVGKMIKDLFQMVRELRVIDERKTYYEETEAQLERPTSERNKSSEITLKDIYINLVQGGAKSATSVFGMARELEFVTLPDLYFDAPPFKNLAELERHVKLLEKDFNQSVIRVLERHLRQFMEWKKRTYKELMNRRRFTLQYLSQHFEIIKMYITWLKPYLRHIERLTLKDSRMRSPDMVSAFEGSMLDIEFLARYPKNGANGCILATFSYRTRAELKVQQEGYQRGPVHIGKMTLDLRVYGWTDEKLENYKRLKDKETIMLMGNVSTSILSAMESLGVELDRYLIEAKGETEKKDNVSKEAELRAKQAKKSIFETLFGDFYTSKSVDSGLSKKELKKLKEKEDKALASIEAVVGHAKFHCWNVLKAFKKSHGMIAW